MALLHAPNVQYEEAITEAHALLEPEGFDNDDEGYKQYARGQVELITGLFYGSMEAKAQVAREIGLDPDVIA